MADHTKPHPRFETIPHYKWEEYQAVIVQQYVAVNMTLKELRVYMARYHNFNAK
jgi:Clr5 domain